MHMALIVSVTRARNPVGLNLQGVPRQDFFPAEKGNEASINGSLLLSPSIFLFSASLSLWQA